MIQPQSTSKTICDRPLYTINISHSEDVYHKNGQQPSSKYFLRNGGIVVFYAYRSYRDKNRLCQLVKLYHLKSSYTTMFFLVTEKHWEIAPLLLHLDIMILPMNVMVLDVL